MFYEGEIIDDEGNELVVILNQHFILEEPFVPLMKIRVKRSLKVFKV